LWHEQTGPAATLLNPNQGIATLDLEALLGNPKLSNQRLLDSAFRQVEKTYYKPVNAQVLVNGEQRELVSLLRSHKISTSLPVSYASGDESRDLALLNRNLQLAQNASSGKVPASTVTKAAIKGMLSSLGDPYTTYLSAGEIASLEEALKGGDFGGIGVYIVKDPRTHWILVDPIEGTPAFRSGVKTGDRIVAVDGHSVAGLSLDDVEHLIRGRVGTVVQLSVNRHEGSRTISVTREQIWVPSVHAKMEDGFDYVRLGDFGQTSYEEVRRALLDGKAHGAKGYILDLRNNGGGLLDAAVQISSLFIEDGPIVSTIDRAGNRETKDATRDAIGATPLVVLVNKYTASASEITAGAIQDYRVGPLIGTKTFGKGVVQSIYNLNDGGALKITTARYVTPHGRDIQHRGIEPDQYVNQVVEAPIIDTPKDLQLAAAKAYLRRVARR
ncbi:MAG: S41 family peptidase, partial [Candidatus Eremiobacteraeota bacterium]|nr:S41 family peptidase [Candidatus Eremiobacteraeota bacterium]